MTTSTQFSVPHAAMETIPLVWMYHSISPYEVDPYQVTVSPQRFEKQMEWIRRRGLRGVAMGELLDAHAQGYARGMVGLTFDDGYHDFITNALPVLARHGFTATVFVLAGRFGGQNEWSRPGPEKSLLSAQEVRTVAESGMEIGCHGLEHVSLPGADDLQLKEEVFQSRSTLEKLIRREIHGFCYPYGHVDDRILGAVVGAGYDYACAVQPGPDIGRWAIPRTLVHDRDTSLRLAAKRIVSILTVGNRRGVRHYRKAH